MRFAVLLLAVLLSSFARAEDIDLVKAGSKTVYLDGGAESDWSQSLKDQKLFADIYEQQAQKDGLSICPGERSYFQARRDGVEFCGAAHRIGLDVVVNTHISVEEKTRRGCDLYLEYYSMGLARSQPAVAVKAVKGAVTEVCFKQRGSRVQIDYRFSVIRRERSLLYPLIKREFRKNLTSFLMVLERQLLGLK